MKLSLRSDLYYQVYGPATFFFSIACSRLGGQKILSESIRTHPQERLRELEVGTVGNRILKWHVEDASEVSVTYEAEIEPVFNTVEISKIPFQSIEAMDEAGIPYLFPSRYVPSDRMRTAAFDLFGGIEGPFDVAMAIEEWLFQNISYQIGTSIEQSSAADTFIDRVGVCRDFAHLGIAFCRALNIPARYVTVYAYRLQPQDFHAVFEVFIDGQWYLVDGTRIAPLNGMVRIASGRDAGDVAAAMLFGNVSGNGIQVSVEQAGNSDEFVYLTRSELMNRGEAIRMGALDATE
jgi:transglutaminase-like putative cysteine protease